MYQRHSLFHLTDQSQLHQLHLYFACLFLLFRRLQKVKKEQATHIETIQLKDLSLDLSFKSNNINEKNSV